MTTGNFVAQFSLVNVENQQETKVLLYWILHVLLRVLQFHDISFSDA